MSEKLKISKVQFQHFNDMLRNGKLSKSKDKSLRVQVPPPAPEKRAPKIRQHQGLPPPPKGIAQIPVTVTTDREDQESYGSCLETHTKHPRSSGIVLPPPTANVPKTRRQGGLPPPPKGLAPPPKGQGQRHRMPCALAAEAMRVIQSRAKPAVPVPQKKKGKGLPPPSNGVHGVFPPPSKVVSLPKKGRGLPPPPKGQLPTPFIPDQGDSSTESDSQANSPVPKSDSNDDEMPGTTLKLIDDGVETDTDSDSCAPSDNGLDRYR